MILDWKKMTSRKAYSATGEAWHWLKTGYRTVMDVFHRLGFPITIEKVEGLHPLPGISWFRTVFTSVGSSTVTDEVTGAADNNSPVGGAQNVREKRTGIAGWETCPHRESGEAWENVPAENVRAARRGTTPSSAKPSFPVRPVMVGLFCVLMEWLPHVSC